VLVARVCREDEDSRSEFIKTIVNYGLRVTHGERARRDGAAAATRATEESKEGRGRGEERAPILQLVLFPVHAILLPRVN